MSTATYMTGVCFNGRHRRCPGPVQRGGFELRCSCSCHDRPTPPARPIPDAFLGRLEELEHRAGQLNEVDIPDLLDQADSLDDVSLAAAYDRLRTIRDELDRAAHELLLEISQPR